LLRRLPAVRFRQTGKEVNETGAGISGPTHESEVKNMGENNENLRSTVILPLDKYETLIRESERLNAVTGPLIRAVRDSLYMTDGGMVLVNSSPILEVFKAVCPDYYDEWLEEAERQRAKKAKELEEALNALRGGENGGTD
jgi:hypothetical protein